MRPTVIYNPLGEDDDDEFEPEPEPEPTSERPFQILDAMLLIAALFVALAWDRDRLLDPLRFLASGPRGLSGLFWRIALAVANLVEVVPPFLAVGSLTMLVLRLRRPRPGWPLLLRQQGTVACAVASLVMIPTALADFASRLMAGFPWRVAWSLAVDDLQPERITGLTIMISLSVLITWVVLAATRRLRPAPGWIDRLGRLVGLGWLLMLPAGIMLAIVRLAGLF